MRSNFDKDLFGSREIDKNLFLQNGTYTHALSKSWRIKKILKEYGTKFLDQLRYTAAWRGKNKYLAIGSNKNRDAVFIGC